MRALCAATALMLAVCGCGSHAKHHAKVSRQQRERARIVAALENHGAPFERLRCFQFLGRTTCDILGTGGYARQAGASVCQYQPDFRRVGQAAIFCTGGWTHHAADPNQPFSPHPPTGGFEFLVMVKGKG